MAEVEIYSAAVCPFAHRARLTLREKGVEFRLHEIDLHHKPEWFSEVSPHGEVPVLLRGGDRVWESTVILEYLDEVFPEPPLLPDTPGRRALARIWIDVANRRFVPSFYGLLTEQDTRQQGDRAQQLLNHLIFLEQGLAELGAAPYWFGPRPTLVDLAFYPWFERWPVLEHYRGAAFPPDLPRLAAWWAAMKEREAVQRAAQTPGYYIEQYAGYAEGRR